MSSKKVAGVRKKRRTNVAADGLIVLGIGIDGNCWLDEGCVSVWGRFYFWAGRITNPPWGAPLRSQIRNPAGFAMPAPILKRTLG